MDNSVFLVGCLVLFTLGNVGGKSCSSTDTDWGSPNKLPILSGDKLATYVNETTQGILYEWRLDDGVTIPLVHVYGSAYEQGCAQGKLLQDSVASFINGAWDYCVENVYDAIVPYSKPWAARVIAVKGLAAALDMEYEITVNWTSPDFYQELHGIADCAGVDYDKVRRLHQIPGITKGACSMFGSWGDAVADPGNSMVQFRSLDWDMNGPWVDYPSITVYHPEGPDGLGHPYLNVGFPGWAGALTGISAAGLAISEIGVTYPDDSFGAEQGMIPLPGTPFIDLLRNVLKYDDSLPAALDRMRVAQRTENLILGVGDGDLQRFRSVQYGPDVFTVIGPGNFIPVAEWHPPVNNTVYHGMDWDCPSFNEELGALLQANYGQISGVVTIRNIIGQLESGSNHIAVYDPVQDSVWVSFARPHDVQGPENAYERQFTEFSPSLLFRVAQPSSSQ